MRPQIKIGLSLLIALLVLVSSTRDVDDYTSSALKSAAITYATARGLNAIVSMMQSSNIEAGIGIVSGSMTIGELLDPLNDMIERFSTVMTWVLASLAAQKVLLLVASHSVFLYLVAVLGVSAILLICFGKPALQGLVFKLFLVVIFLRFALGFAVTLNSGVDYLFLNDQFKVNDKEVTDFQQKMLKIDPDDKLNTKNLRNSTISFFQSLSLTEFNKKISQGIENFVNLVAIYLLKTVFFPLFFFYGVFYVLRQLWRIDLVDLPPYLTNKRPEPVV